MNLLRLDVFLAGSRGESSGGCAYVFPCLARLPLLWLFSVPSRQRTLACPFFWATRPTFSTGRPQIYIAQQEQPLVWWSGKTPPLPLPSRHCLLDTLAMFFRRNHPRTPRLSCLFLSLCVIFRCPFRSSSHFQEISDTLPIDKADALQRLLEEEKHTSFAKVSRGGKGSSYTRLGVPGPWRYHGF